MKRIAIAAAIGISLATAGCSQTASTSDPSQSPTVSASTASSAPTATSSKSTSTAASNASASQTAANLGCENISTETPVGTTPNAKTMVRCTLSNQGYHVLAFDSAAATTVAVRSLQAQANGSGETMTIATATKWIVKAAEGPTIGAPMVSAAQKQGAKKLILT